MKIYFDACCYNRPFDDLSNEKIRLEAEAVLIIQGMFKNKAFSLYSSRVIDFELGKIKDIFKKIHVMAFYHSAKSQLLEFCNEIETIADNLEKKNIRYMDALHVAYCKYYKIDYLLTTDKALINSAVHINISLKVINPLEFIMEVM